MLEGEILLDEAFAVDAFVTNDSLLHGDILSYYEIRRQPKRRIILFNHNFIPFPSLGKQRRGYFSGFRWQEIKLMQQKGVYRPKRTLLKNSDLLSSLRQSRQDWRQTPLRCKQFTTIQPSLYSLAAQSTKLINQIQLPQPKKVNPHRDHRDRRSQSQMLGRAQQSMGQEGDGLKIEREIRLHRYSRELRQSEMGEGGLLRKIIDHYKIKSLERSYYDNLDNNLGMKISNRIQNNNRVKVKGTLKLSRNKDRESGRHINSIEIDSLFQPSIKAQTINPPIQDHSAEISLLNSSAVVREKLHSTSKGAAFYSTQKKSCESSESKQNLLELSENAIVQKVNKYKEFLFLVNWAHGVYRQLDIHKHLNPFKVYVGRGNNSNLIRAIVKQRFWLEETKHKNDAQILWTQLKEEAVFKRQTKKPKEAELNNEQVVEKRDMLAQDNQNVIISKGAVAEARNKNDKAIKINLKTMELLEPHSRVLTKSQLQGYRALMQRYTYKKQGLFGQRLKYLGTLKRIAEQQLGESIIHNHLPLNGVLGNKKAMFYILKEYYRLINKDVFEVVPLTFHIRKINDDQFKAFVEKYNEVNSRGRPNVWIMKPGQFSNRGHGIKCVSRVEEVRARASQLGHKKSLIVQEYLINPLLYNGRKFDIRTYMLISVNNGLLRAYWYQQGYVRTSSQSWRLDSLADPYVHLTNDAVQLNSEDYGKFEPGNKLSYAELERYIEGLPKNSGKSNPTFHSHIHPLLKQIAVDAVRASFGFIDPDRSSSNFQLFGFDFMIDSSFKPWLIEINTNPCLELSSPLLRRIIPSMVQNAFRLAVDPVFPPPLNYSSTHKYGIPQNALHYNRFQLIFDEQRDGAALDQLYHGSLVMQAIEDFEQDKQTYQQEGEEIEMTQKS